MVPRAIKRAFYALLTATGVGLSVVALFLLSRTAQNSEEFGRLHDIILLINIAGAFVLFVLSATSANAGSLSTIGMTLVSAAFSSGFSSRIFTC